MDQAFIAHRNVLGFSVVRTGGAGGYVRPTTEGHEMRMLQIPEIRAAMGFLDDYVLAHGNRREKIKLLDNPVCPPVIAAVIRARTL